MTPEDVATLSTEASGLFAAIVGQLMDANLHKLHEVLFPILLDIPYDLVEGKQKLVGIISDDTNYNTDYGLSFVRLARKAAYDDTLSKNANNVVCAKAEATWKAALADERLYGVAECKTRLFILAKVEDTW